MPDGPFVDTWGWMALGHRREPRHREIRAYYQQLRAQHSVVYTSDYVLDEVITLLFRRAVFAEAMRFLEGLFTAAERGHLRIERITSARFSSAWGLRQRFQDKPRISFTDLTSMIIMQEHDVRQIVTEDEHFFHVGMGFLKVP
jgi:predicted nucleic acid-binding protein